MTEPPSPSKKAATLENMRELLDNAASVEEQITRSVIVALVADVPSREGEPLFTDALSHKASAAISEAIAVFIHMKSMAQQAATKFTQTNSVTDAVLANMEEEMITLAVDFVLAHQDSEESDKHQALFELLQDTAIAVVAPELEILTGCEKVSDSHSSQEGIITKAQQTKPLKAVAEKCKLLEQQIKDLEATLAKKQQLIDGQFKNFLGSQKQRKNGKKPRR